MKKLVTLFTLAIAMVASADVASDNVVGYTAIDTPQYVNMITGVAFANVGGGNVDIQTLSMSSAAAPDGGTRIWWWDDSVSQYTSAYWVELYDAEGNPVGKNGWGDAANWVAISKTFAPGDGFWVNAAANAKLLVSGQVVTTSTASQYVGIPLSQYVNVQITNPMPVGSTDLQTITMSSAAAPDGGTRIWWWDDSVSQYTSAYWVELYDAEGNPVGTNGWGDAANWVAISKTFPAGGGFWINAAANSTIQFVNPFYVQ